MRETTRPDVESEQTHDDCEWLNEEDGEEDVLGNGSGPRGCSRPPSVAQDESRNLDRQNNPGAEDRRGDRGNKRGVGLTGTLAL